MQALLDEREARVNSISLRRRVRFWLKRIIISPATRPAINIGMKSIDLNPQRSEIRLMKQHGTIRVGFACHWIHFASDLIQCTFARWAVRGPPVSRTGRCE